MSKYFYTQKAKGKTVEEIVKNHMLSRGHIVIDVSEDCKFQLKDTDFILVNKDMNQSVSLEVKRDDNIRKTGNFFFEIESEDQYGRIRDGWVKKTTADFLCFYDTKVNKGYVIAWTALKETLSTFGREKSFYDKYDQKITKSRLIPIGTLKKNGYVVYEWEDNL